MNSDSSPYLDDQYSESLGADVLSIALIGPDENRRQAAASALAGCHGGEIREFSSYPSSLDDVPKLLEQHYDVIIIDLDSNPEYALKLVESICANDTATVMVYSVKTDSELLVRCMRAGAREFLTLPFAQNTMAEALVRASARRPSMRPATVKKASGRLLAFLGAKGGDGVTTLACNFAVSLAQESGQSTLLIDLNLPLGDAALNLGVSAEYSTINALQNAGRLDSSFLSTLLVKHSSGVFVLAAPGKFPQFEATDEAIDKLIAVARQDFDNVVVDMGSRLDLMGTSLFKDGSTIYLVIQTGIAGLRNSNRLISQYFTSGVPKLEIVLNRFQSRSLGVSEDQITKALTRPAQWKIPNDYAAVRRMHTTAVPLALEDSPISRLVHQMARSACGLPASPEKGIGFSFKKISRSISAKMSSSEEAPAFTQPGLTSGQDRAVTAPGATQPDVMAKISGESVPASPADAVLAAGTQASLTPAETADRTDHADAKGAQPESVSAPSQQGEAETRTYRGVTYVKGADDEWHMQKTQSNVVSKETPIIAWSTPAPIAYGTTLSVTQLNAMASVPGRFAYTPAAGEVLAAGTHTLSIVFTPTDAAGYSTAQATVSLTVTKTAPAITWPTPAPIVYGAPLSATQLNATASVSGKFVYIPAAGEVLTAGVQTLSVTFTPTDAADYTAAQATVSLTVTKTAPAITWPTPAPIAYGAPLGATQLNATALVPGRFVYTPAAGEVLTAGVQTLSVTFTPTNAADYKTAQATVSLTVTKTVPAITWPTPASIAYGTALSAAQLNATASVPGTFVYTPAAGEVLTAGVQTLSVTFTPTDAADYTAAQAAVSLTITKATPIITWPTPASISYGTALGAAQLNATALVPGRFVYTPAVGEVLTAGVQKLSVTFAPTDAADYTAVQAAVSLTVAKATPITRPTPAAISHGDPLSAAQFNVESQPAPAKAAPAQVKEPAAQAKPTPTKPPAKAHAEPPVESPALALVKVQGSKPRVDVGPGLDLMGSAVFEDGTTIYLVMQPGSAGLPNSSRLVSQFFAGGGPKPEIMVNPLEPRSSDVDEGQTATALTKPASSPFSQLIGQMVQPASDQPTTSEKSTKFSLKGFSRSIWSKISTTEKPPSITQPGVAADLDDTGTQISATANIPGKSVYVPAVGTVLAAGARTPFTPTDTMGRTDFAGVKGGGRSVGVTNQQGEPETRTYKGATYVRGADGQWHLQSTQTSGVNKKTSAVAWTAPARIAYGAAPSASHKSKPAPAKAVAKVRAKAPAKRLIKAAIKPPAKAPAKRLIKAAAKPPAKAPAKRLIKAAAKPPAKAPVRKSAPAKKKPVPALSPKPAKAVKSSKPAVNKPAPEPAKKNQALRQLDSL